MKCFLLSVLFLASYAASTLTPRPNTVSSVSRRGDEGAIRTAIEKKREDVAAAALGENKTDLVDERVPTLLYRVRQRQALLVT